MYLQTFCDESSDGKSERTIVLAGYVGTENQWQRFDEEWKNTLSEYDVVVFHSVDCEAGKKSFQRFHSNKRATLQRQLINVINSSGVTGVSVGMFVEDYYAISDLREFEKIPNGLSISGNLSDPYFLPFKLLIEQIVFNAPSIGADDQLQIGFTFDRNTKVQGRAKGMYENLFKWDRPWTKNLDPLGIKFADKSRISALQAADFLAYESFRWLDESHRRKKPERWQWRRIKESINPQRMHLIDKEGLKNFTESLSMGHAERMLDIERRLLIDIVAARGRSLGGQLVKKGVELTFCDTVTDLESHIQRNPTANYSVLAHIDLDQEGQISRLAETFNLRIAFYCTNTNNKGEVLLLPRDLDIAAKFLE
jgi:hypothetical protein